MPAVADGSDAAEAGVMNPDKPTVLRMPTADARPNHFLSENNWSPSR
jgi:hypothetical protein